MASTKYIVEIRFDERNNFSL